MNDLQRDAAQWLARYRQEERPPPAVDFMIRARIRRDSRDRARALWLVTCAVAAAAILLVLWVLDFYASLPRGERDASFAAPYMGPYADVRRVKARPRSAPQPATTPDPVELKAPDPHALLEARRYIDAGKHEVALKLLKPCPQKIGTDALLEDCESWVIEATCKSGDLAAGHDLVAAFRKRWPESRHTTSFSNFCPK